MLFSTKYWVVMLCLLLGGALSVRPALAQKMRETKFEKGELDKGRKIGIWEYYGYTPSGEKVIVQRFDHNANQLLYFRPGADVLCHAELSPGKWSYVRPDRPAMFIGGDAQLANYTKRLVYPEQALTHNIQGKVVVSIQIDTLGRAGSYKLLQHVGGGCDEEAMRIAHTVPADQWIPARVGSHAVASEYELPLNFRLQ